MSDRRKRRICVISGCILALVFIMAVFSVRNVDPQNTGWVVGGGGDNLQHYLGWRFFRESRWTRYLFFMQDLNYPVGTSVIVTDSNPLFCLIFKLFRNVIPETFQFNGIWILSSYLLLAFFAAEIVWYLTKDPALTVSAVILSLLNPVILQRALIHDTLTAHWLILAAFWLCLHEDRKWNVPGWILLIETTLLIHVYFIPMIAFVFLLQMIRMLKRKYSLPRLIVPCLAFLLSLSAGYFAFGYSHVLPQSGSFGELSLNLNAFINPDSVPALLSPRPQNPLQYEGFNYWGAGLFLLLLSVIVLTGKHFFRGILIYIIPAVLLILLSASNDVYFDRSLVFHVDLPEKLYSALSVFRSSGRLVWPLYYCVMFAALSALSKFSEKKLPVRFLVILCAVLQAADMSAFIQESALRFRDPSNHLTEIGDSFQRLIPEAASHMYCSEGDAKDMDALALFASEMHMTYNRSANARGIENVFGGDPLDMTSLDCSQLKSDSVYIYLSADTFPEQLKTCRGFGTAEYNDWMIVSAK